MTIASEDPVIPSLPELLNALSTAPRSNREKERDIGLRNTLKALLSRACLDNVPIREYACLAILLAFKRRNHQKSMAAGDGDGERSFLRAVLLELYSLAEDHSEGADLRRMVELVLPLVPHYGSWRDLLLLGELSFPEYTSDMDVKEPLHPPALAQTVGKIFANQLSHDMEMLVLSQQQESNDKNFVPSNACKYAPHENRHSGNKTFKEEKVKSPRKSKLIYLNRIQRCLGDYVATMLQGRDNNLPLRHFYRKFLSKLKAILTESGFVIEPLLCKRDIQSIDFNCANKGALSKNKKCLEKNPLVKAKWRRAMMNASSAVPDLDGLLQISMSIIEEHRSIEDLGDRISSLQILKCIESFMKSQSDLRAKANSLLNQLKTGDDTKKNAECMQAKTLPFVDSCGCENLEEFISLALSAFLSAQTQSLLWIVIDGETVQLPLLDFKEHQNRKDALKSKNEAVLSVSSFFEDIFCLGETIIMGNEGGPSQMNIRGMRNTRELPFLDRIYHNCEVALNYYPKLASAESSVDLLCLTRCDASREDVSADSYHEMITKLRLSHSTQLGCISFYRMSDCQAGADSSINPFVLRFKPSSLNPSDVSLDLCLVMDLTASMGCWMEAAKAHLADIVDSLKKETNIGCIRISYIGYRDWQDNGRLVVHDFVPIESVGDSLLPLMKKQQPSGGGDMEEDVLIAFYAAQTQLSWNGNIRVMIHVADAPAHGFGGSGDRFKSGRCPDQQPPHPSLDESLRNLAGEKKMDLLFCQVCSSFSSKMVRMFKGVYNDGPGFGVLTIEQGASKFKDAVLSTLSTSMLEALAPEDIPGLQCFSGGTASSLLRVLNSNLRGAVDSFFREEESTAGLEGVDCCLGDEESDEDNGNSDLPGSHAGRSNHDRLMSELEADDLQPVRLALGMYTQAKLQSEAAALLLSNGVSVEIMMALSYPDEIIQLMRQEGMKRLKTL